MKCLSPPKENTNITATNKENSPEQMPFRKVAFKNISSGNRTKTKQQKTKKRP